MAGLFSVLKIDLGNRCMGNDVCVDDSAECTNGACGCVGSYTQIGTQCGTICKKYLIHYLVGII